MAAFRLIAQRSELGRTLDRQLAGTGTFENFVHVCCGGAHRLKLQRRVRNAGGLSCTNAGAFAQGRFERVDRYPIEEVRQLLDVNVVGVFTVLSAVSTAMIAAGSGGAVVISASMAGVTGAPNMSAYSAHEGRGGSA